ncbi:MAG: coenzyme F420-0:L-glutamate ligase [Bacillota bacterium]|nr:coenzyme F420-0:L-glutamate ligase [Bacillota bacterium]MDD3298877.1 coenzyme F420-0:L-glutamate ligase [Bacillota bacterium]MDD3851959.1 coenzyme F420-0:L-glutamate ligase [Bacillota bacterium]MDD4708278.1 coenzyme F420-0:L-glutamate ligase [Bacillota bacterium]
MTRTVGTTVRGIRAPIINEGDDLVKIVVDSVTASMASEKFDLRDRDVIGITESFVARAQGNYASLEDIASDVRDKFAGEIAVLFPILSRNRFSMVLKAIAMGAKKVYLFLKYPSDEMGNPLMDIERMDEAGINPYTDVLTEEGYREVFGDNVPHPFTGIDYVSHYKGLAQKGNIDIILVNNPKVALDYTEEILTADVHARHRTKRILKAAGAKKVYGLDDLLTKPVNGSGYNPEFGLLGSNKATETSVKLFPRDCQKVVNEVQQALLERTGKLIEVLIYGDGAFKDPQCKIWELADPVVSPGYTAGLRGTPNEIKIKLIADNELEGLKGSEKAKAIKERIKQKNKNRPGGDESLGTTPRQLTDLLGSLCDLTSGSGDKGTPIVLVQGYFDDFSKE